jgi:hypothetical protein
MNPMSRASLHAPRLDEADWIETGQRPQDVAGRESPATRFVHRDGLLEAATLADGRPLAFYVVGRSQAYPTLAEARQVLARSH